MVFSCQLGLHHDRGSQQKVNVRRWQIVSTVFLSFVIQNTPKELCCAVRDTYLNQEE